MNKYGLCILLSLIIGFIFITLNLRKTKLNTQSIILLYMLNLCSTIYFAKLLTVIQSHFQVSIIKAGFSSLGGATGLLLSTLIFIKINPTQHTEQIINTYTLSLPLIYSISKLGCYYAKCCGGRPIQGITIPIQLIESIVFIILFITLYKTHQTTPNIIIASAISKFLLDYLREAHINKFITVNQIICIAFILINIFIINKNLIKKGVKEQ